MFYEHTAAVFLHAVAMMWRVSPALPGILSVIGFSGSGLVSLSVVSNTNVYSYTTQAISRWSMSFYCDIEV